MQKETKILMNMPWKHRLIIFGLGLISVIVCIVTFDSVALRIKGILFSWILLLVSYYDFRTRSIPDLVHLIIMLLALIDISWMSSILGLIIVPLPFFIMACIIEKSFGGGDIKLIGACSFFCGFIIGYQAIVLALCFVILFIGMNNIFENNHYNVSFPFAPYISLSYLMMYLL